MSQTHQSEQFRILKQYIEQKDFDNFNGFLDNNEISKKTLNSILCFTLQNYRSNYEMSDYIQLLIEKAIISQQEIRDAARIIQQELEKM